MIATPALSSPPRRVVPSVVMIVFPAASGSSLQVAAEIDERDPFYADIDLVLHGSPQERQEQLAAGIGAVLSRMVKPKLSQQGNIGFQVTRGRLGVSL